MSNRNGLKCPVCKSHLLNVIDTRPKHDTVLRRRQEFIELRNRPRLPPPAYRGGPLAPYEIQRQRALNEFCADRDVLFEDINFDQWRRLSAERAVPTGAIWVAALGIVYGPKITKQAKAA